MLLVALVTDQTECDGRSGMKFLLWGVAKGSSVSWVAKFKGDKNSECKLSNGRSRSYRVIKQGDKTASFC